MFFEYTHNCIYVNYLIDVIFAEQISYVLVLVIAMYQVLAELLLNL